jgi:hypothetical protein
MRKVGGVLLAVAMLLPAALMTAPAGAAGGTTCKSGTASGAFAPALPPLTSKAKVKDVITATGALKTCTGSVKAASFKFVSTKSTGSNCSTLLTYTTTKSGLISGTLTITWNTKATSTVALTFNDVKGKATTNAPSGKVTAGLFKGSSFKTTFTYKAVPATGCVSTPLSKVSVTIGAITIK